MMRIPFLAAVMLALALGIVLGACGGGPTPAAAPTVEAPGTGATAAPPAGSPTAPPAAGGTTAGQLADQGKTVFADRCAACHGQQGEGLTAPANIGPSANLGKYGTAKGLYDYVRTTMPQDAPGSLSEDQYLAAVSYLLVENGFVEPEMPMDQTHLESIQLSK